MPQPFSNILNESFLFKEELVKFSMNHEYIVTFVSNAPNPPLQKNIEFVKVCMCS